MTDTLPKDVEEVAEPRGPRLPDIPGPWETAVLLWRRLRRMSTALMLLFAMAAAAVIATFIPQEPVASRTVTEWRTGVAGPGEEAAAVFDTLGFFDVFGSWWFMTLTVLLFISLTGCLLPRYRAFWRTVRRPPAVGRNLGRLSNRVTLHTTLDPDAALEVVESILRRKRFRRRRVAPGRVAPAGVAHAEAPEGGSGAQLAAERGHWREGGSLVFHTAFYVLLVGILIGHSFGFVGQLNVAEGQAFTDTRIQYGLAEPGRYFDVGDHRGFTVRLDDFDATYFPNQVPKDFVSSISILEGGEVVRAGEQVRVNHPVVHDGMKIFQVRFGMAPRIIVRAGDTVLFDDQVILAQSSGNTWTGQAKISLGSPQILLDMILLPDAGVATDAEGTPQIVNRSPEARNVRVFADLWVGELGLERPVPPSEFIREGEPLRSVALAEGDVVDLLDGEQELSLEFAELTMWSGFQVSHAPGRWILLLAGMLILVGLIPSLYSYRRRIWAEASPVDGGTRLLLAGVALQRKPLFVEAFEQFAGDVRNRLRAAEEHA